MVGKKLSVVEFKEVMESLEADNRHREGLAKELTKELRELKEGECLEYTLETGRGMDAGLLSVSIKSLAPRGVRVFQYRLRIYACRVNKC